MARSRQTPQRTLAILLFGGIQPSRAPHSGDVTKD